jgi:hypothetical protein
MTDINPTPSWANVRQLETNEYATGGLNGNMNEQAKSLAGQNMYSRLYAGLPFDPVFTAQVGGFPIGGRAALENGDIVISTTQNNLNSPNSNMIGWITEESYNFRKRFKVVADPRDFGAKNNGTDDDAAGVREAVAYLQSLGGGILFMQSNIAWQLKTLHSNNTDAIVLDTSNILLDFGTQLTNINVATEMQAAFKLSDTYKNNISIIGGRIEGNQLAQYGLYSDPSAYNPYMNIQNFDVFGCSEAAASINPYMSTIINSKFSFSKKGLVLNNSGGVRENTSTTLIGVYSNSCTEKGFEFNNSFMYANMLSCGVDHCDGIAYDLEVKGANLSGIGAEHSGKLLRFKNFNDAVTITGVVGVNIGSLDSGNPADAAIEFSGNGQTTNQLTGVKLFNSAVNPRFRSKDLLLNITSGKYPRVNIPDGCITRDKTQVNIADGVTSIYEEPITFGVSRFTRSKNETITAANLKATLDIYNKNRLEFAHVIQISNGSEDLEKIIEKITGEGRYIIQGNGGDRTAVKLRGARLGMTIKNCTAEITLRNLTLENNTGYNDPSLAQLYVDNCRKVILDNVLFDATKHTIGTAVRAMNGSEVIISNGTVADTRHAAATVWQELTNAKITIAPMPAPPSTGQWQIGQRIKNSAIGTGNIIEWVRVRNAGNTADEWRPIII